MNNIEKIGKVSFEEGKGYTIKCALCEATHEVGLDYDVSYSLRSNKWYIPFPASLVNACQAVAFDRGLPLVVATRGQAFCPTCAEVNSEEDMRAYVDRVGAIPKGLITKEQLHQRGKESVAQQEHFFKEMAAPLSDDEREVVEQINPFVGGSNPHNYTPPSTTAPAQPHAPVAPPPNPKTMQAIMKNCPPPPTTAPEPTNIEKVGKVTAVPGSSNWRVECCLCDVATEGTGQLMLDCWFVPNRSALLDVKTALQEGYDATLVTALQGQAFCTCCATLNTDDDMTCYLNDLSNEDEVLRPIKLKSSKPGLTKEKEQTAALEEIVDNLPDAATSVKETYQKLGEKLPHHSAGCFAGRKAPCDACDDKENARLRDAYHKTLEETRQKLLLDDKEKDRWEWTCGEGSPGPLSMQSYFQNAVYVGWVRDNLLKHTTYFFAHWITDERATLYVALAPRGRSRDLCEESAVKACAAMQKETGITYEVVNYFLERDTGFESFRPADVYLYTKKTADKPKTGAFFGACTFAEVEEFAHSYRAQAETFKKLYLKARKGNEQLRAEIENKKRSVDWGMGRDVILVRIERENRRLKDAHNKLLSEHIKLKCRANNERAFNSVDKKLDNALAAQVNYVDPFNTPHGSDSYEPLVGEFELGAECVPSNYSGSFTLSNAVGFLDLKDMLEEALHTLGDVTVVSARKTDRTSAEAVVEKKGQYYELKASLPPQGGFTNLKRVKELLVEMFLKQIEATDKPEPLDEPTEERWTWNQLSKENIPSRIRAVVHDDSCESWGHLWDGLNKVSTHCLKSFSNLFVVVSSQSGANEQTMMMSAVEANRKVQERKPFRFSNVFFLVELNGEFHSKSPTEAAEALRVIEKAEEIRRLSEIAKEKEATLHLGETLVLNRHDVIKEYNSIRHMETTSLRDPTGEMVSESRFQFHCHACANTEDVVGNDAGAIATFFIVHTGWFIPSPSSTRLIVRALLGESLPERLDLKRTARLARFYCAACRATTSEYARVQAIHNDPPVERWTEKEVADMKEKGAERFKELGWDKPDAYWELRETLAMELHKADSLALEETDPAQIKIWRIAGTPWDSNPNELCEHQRDDYRETAARILEGGKLHIRAVGALPDQGLYLEAVLNIKEKEELGKKEEPEKTWRVDGKVVKGGTEEVHAAVVESLREKTIVDMLCAVPDCDSKVFKECANHKEHLEVLGKASDDGHRIDLPTNSILCPHHSADNLPPYEEVNATPGPWVDFIQEDLDNAIPEAMEKGDVDYYSRVKVKHTKAEFNPHGLDGLADEQEDEEVRSHEFPREVRSHYNVVGTLKKKVKHAPTEDDLREDAKIAEESAPLGSYDEDEEFDEKQLAMLRRILNEEDDKEDVFAAENKKEDVKDKLQSIFDLHKEEMEMLRKESDKYREALRCMIKHTSKAMQEEVADLLDGET